MGFTNAKQLWELFLSGGMGFILGAYYDVFRIWRRTVRSSVVAVFFQDCLFFATSAVIIFLFSLAMTDGVVRVYVLCGAALGYFAYRHTVGNLLLELFNRLILGVRFIKRCLKAVLLPPIFWMKSGLLAAGGKVWEKCCKIAKKSKKNFKKVLQPIRKLLYNRTV